MQRMSIIRIQALLRAASIPEVSQKTGLSVRSLFRIKAGETNITLATLNKLEEWARGRRAPTTTARMGRKQL